VQYSANLFNIYSYIFINKSLWIEKEKIAGKTGLEI